MAEQLLHWLSLVWERLQQEATPTAFALYLLAALACLAIADAYEGRHRGQ